MPGDGKYVTAKQGDDVASIAKAERCPLKAIKDDAKNKDIMENRGEGYVLAPGDKVWVPKPDPEGVKEATGRTYTYELKGAMESLNIRFLDDQEKPRVGVSYTIKIDGGTEITGDTDEHGFLRVAVPMDASKAVLELGSGETTEHYTLALGHLLPIEQDEGVRQRLVNLGYVAVESDDREALVAGIKKFQRDKGLAATGEITSETTKKLKDLFMS